MADENFSSRCRDSPQSTLQNNNGPSTETEGTDFGARVFFLAGVTLASMVGGFGFAVGQARRRSPGAFDAQQEEGVRLALRALGWGTLYAVSGVGLLVLGVKTALGVKNAKEFGEKMKSILPSKDGKVVSYFEPWRIPRNSGKTDDGEQ